MGEDGALVECLGEMQLVEVWEADTLEGVAVQVKDGKRPLSMDKGGNTDKGGEWYASCTPGAGSSGSF